MYTYIYTYIYITVKNVWLFQLKFVVSTETDVIEALIK